MTSPPLLVGPGKAVPVGIIQSFQVCYSSGNPGFQSGRNEADSEIPVVVVIDPEIVTLYT